MRYYLELTLAIIATTIAVLLPVILMVVSRVKIAQSKKGIITQWIFSLCGVTTDSRCCSSVHYHV